MMDRETADRLTGSVHAAGGTSRGEPASSPVARKSAPRVRLLRVVLWVVLGLALRAVALDGDGLWCDEGYTAWTCGLTAAEHRVARAHDDAPPLYYALQRAILPHLPPGEGSVRLLSAAAGVAGLVWLVAAPPIPGLVEAPVALFAVGTYGVYFGRLARSYSVLMLFGLVMMTGTHRFLEGRRRWLIAVVLAETLALWTHNVAAPLIVGANMAWLLCGRRDPLRWIGGQLLVLLTWLPYIAGAAPQFAVHSLANRWIGEYWKTVPLALAPLMSLGAFASGARVSPTPPADRWTYSGPGSSMIALLVFAAVAVLLVAAFHRSGRRDAIFCASFTLAPLIALAAASHWMAPAYVLARTDAIGYGGFVLWASLGLRGLPRIPRFGLLTVLVLSTGLAVASRFPVSENRRGNDREIGLGLKKIVRPGDWLVFLGPSRPSIDYYVSGGRPGRPDPAIVRLHFPAYCASNPAAAYPPATDSLDVWNREANSLRDRFSHSPGPPGRYIYLVGMIPPDRPQEAAATDLPYPENVLAYVLNGTRPLHPIARGKSDALAAEWFVFRTSLGSFPLIDDFPGKGAAP